ncbi:MAG: SbcC/MukB-like Walker B domain-containing protein, partial [Bacteroidota bacterium]
LQAGHAGAELAIRQATAAEKELQDKLTAHTREFRWSAYSPGDEKALREAFSRAEKAAQDITAAEEAIAAREEALARAEARREKLRSTLDERRRNIAAFQGEQKTLLAQLKRLTVDQCAPLGDPDLKEKARQLEKQLRNLEEERTRLEEDTRTLTATVSALGGEVEAGSRHLADAESGAARISQAVLLRLEEEHVGSREDVRRILSLPLDPARERRDLEAFHTETRLAADRLSAILRETEGKTYDSTAHDRTRSRLEGTTRGLREKAELIGKLKERAARMHADRESRAVLEKERARLLERGADIEVLKKLFRASGFVNYVSTVYLQDICRAANERFSRLTRQKLSLEITGENAFQVRDFMNDGQTRSAKTLSGGQMFQASLSLALALGDRIQTLAGTDQNFFFLDEGFGSLDREALQVVFETLASLRRENRIVGIISHVDELQQEIPAHIRVRNTEESGTIVEPGGV